MHSLDAKIEILINEIKRTEELIPYAPDAPPIPPTISQPQDINIDDCLNQNWKASVEHDSITFYNPILPTMRFTLSYDMFWDLPSNTQSRICSLFPRLPVAWSGCEDQPF
jgi:hypothetical protein